MSRQLTYWARLPGREVRHLWREHSPFDAVSSACGLLDWDGSPPQSKGRKCLNCVRALKI